MPRGSLALVVVGSEVTARTMRRLAGDKRSEEGDNSELRNGAVSTQRKVVEKIPEERAIVVVVVCDCVCGFGKTIERFCVILFFPQV